MIGADTSFPAHVEKWTGALATLAVDSFGELDEFELREKHVSKHVAHVIFDSTDGLTIGSDRQWSVEFQFKLRGLDDWRLIIQITGTKVGAKDRIWRTPIRLHEYATLDDWEREIDQKIPEIFKTIKSLNKDITISKTAPGER